MLPARLTAWMIVAAPLAAAAPVMAQDAETDEPSPVTCVADGYDVLIRNASDAALAVGTALDWGVTFARRDGRHVLEDPLDPGRMAVLTGALQSTYVGAGTACEVRIGEAE